MEERAETERVRADRRLLLLLLLLKRECALCLGSAAEEEAVRGEGEGAEGEKLEPREAGTDRRSSSLKAAMGQRGGGSKGSWESSRLSGVLETPFQSFKSGLTL
jgi:hypothetical protein